MQAAGYVVDKLGPRYTASLSDGIDFTRSGRPEFVRGALGFSIPEIWGRWSDANIAPAVRIDFVDPLPGKFSMVISLIVFGPNLDKDLIVRTGTQEHIIKLKATSMEVTLAVDLAGEEVDCRHEVARTTG